MPADRLVIVQVATPGDYNQHGEYVEGAKVEIRTWASRRDVSARDIQEGGARDETRRDWLIRWDSRIANASTLDLAVIDGLDTFTISNMVEETRRRGSQDLRRRFLTLQGVFTT